MTHKDHFDSEIFLFDLFSNYYVSSADYSLVFDAFLAHGGGLGQRGLAHCKMSAGAGRQGEMRFDPSSRQDNSPSSPPP